jgi:hypothetical protein
VTPREREQRAFAREMRAGVEARMLPSYADAWPWCPVTSAALDLLIIIEEAA